MRKGKHSVTRYLKLVFIILMLLPIGSCMVNKEIVKAKAEYEKLLNAKNNLADLNNQLADTIYVLSQQDRYIAEERDRLARQAEQDKKQLLEKDKRIEELNIKAQEYSGEVIKPTTTVINRTTYKKDTVQAIYAPDYKNAIQTITTHNADDLNFLEYDQPRKLTIGVSFKDTEDTLIVDMVQVSYTNYDSINPVVFHRAIKRSQLPYEIKYLRPKLTYNAEDFIVQCVTGNDTSPRRIEQNGHMVWSWNVSSTKPGKHTLSAFMLIYGYNQNTENQSTNYKIFDRQITVNDISFVSKFASQLPAFAIDKIYYVITFLLGAVGSKLWKKISPEETKIA